MFLTLALIIKKILFSVIALVFCILDSLNMCRWRVFWYFNLNNYGNKIFFFLPQVLLYLVFVKATQQKCCKGVCFTTLLRNQALKMGSKCRKNNFWDFTTTWHITEWIWFVERACFSEIPLITSLEILCSGSP